MQRFLSLMLATLIIFTASGIANSAEVRKYVRAGDYLIRESEVPKMRAQCNKKRTTCYLGVHRMHSSSQKKPLYVSKNGDILCNNERTECTNGYYTKKTKKPMY